MVRNEKDGSGYSSEHLENQQIIVILTCNSFESQLVCY